MRWLDASHVDTGSFLARRPLLGQCFRLLGHGAAAAAVVTALRAPSLLPWLAVGILVVWLTAWRLAVGGLWRSSLVAALAACVAGLLLTGGTP
jgi:hypothetical protein